MGTLLVGLLLAVVTLVGSAVALGLGSLLSRIFAVTVWQATVVVLAVAAGVLWFLWWVTPTVTIPPETGEEEPDEPPVVIQPDLSWRPGRRNRRRRS